MKEYDSGRIIQMHIVLNTLLAEIIFSIITFNITPDVGTCFFFAFVFYYLLQTVFFWLFIYTLFLQARVHEIFDSAKYNSYTIYIFVGYGLPFIVTLTISGLYFKEEIDEKVCWLLFEGSVAWGFSGVIVTLGVGSLAILLLTIYQSRSMENGIILEEKCIRTMFTQFFVLMTSVFGAFALQERSFFAEYCFSLCNLLQGFSIAIMYCILRREDPIIKANQIGPLPDWDHEDDGKFEDKTAEFKDMESDAERSDSGDDDDGEEKLDMEAEDEETAVDLPIKKKFKHVKDGSTIFLQARKEGDDESDDEERPPLHIPGVHPPFVRPKAPEPSAPQASVGDGIDIVLNDLNPNNSRSSMNPFINVYVSDEDSDQEIDFRYEEIDEVNTRYRAD